MKRLSDQKLQAFQIGSVQERLARKRQEEKKKKEEELAAASVFQEFVATFQATPSTASAGKVWVKAGTFDAGSRKEDTKDKGKLYKPQSKYGDGDKSALERTQEYARLLASENSEAALKKKGSEKKKSNLELFKEELRQIQEEREERHKHKAIIRSIVPAYDEPAQKEEGSFDNGDPNTTNLYLGNLSPKISEQELMKLFGRYGPLASIKIMWPRSEEEKSRGRNCGFVAYMSRRDAERALKHLVGKDVMGYEMKLGWGKAVPIMTHPIYIPPALVEYSLPPPMSGLPFNAQPIIKEELPKMTSNDYMLDDEKRTEMDKLLMKSIVKVCIPTERPILMLIHRMIEFVIREGPMFEALIMNREVDNPMFRFLFDNESPVHIYYRWKLFSLLQGDPINEWNQKEFRMFRCGSIWKPPPTNFYTVGMPEELIADEDLLEPNRGALSVAQRDRLEEVVRRLTPERTKIIDAMIFCIEHADAAEEIAECICESLSNPNTLLHKKIARIYLVSDILHNCSVKVQNASFFRRAMESQLADIFKGLHTAYMAIESRLKAEGFKLRVMQVIHAWEDWAIYSREFLTKLKKIFLGSVEKSPEPVVNKPVPTDNDIDGIPIDENDDDADLPLDGASLLKRAMMTRESSVSPPPQDQTNIYEEDDFDIDGVPIEDDTAFDANNPAAFEPAFVPSKWETVDPEQVEAQAVTTSKWEQMATDQIPTMSLATEAISSESDSDSVDDEDRRTRLRDIEMKVMEYQDEVESGRRPLKSGYTIMEQIEHYRRKLIKKSKKERKMLVSTDSPDRYRQSSPEYKKTKRAKRSPSPYVRAPSPKRVRERERERESHSRERVRESPGVSRRRYESPRKYDSPASRRYRSPSPPKSVRSYRDSPSRYSSSSSSHKSSKHKRKH